MSPRHKSEIGLPAPRQNDVGPEGDLSPAPAARPVRAPRRAWLLRLHVLTVVGAFAGLAFGFFTRPQAASVRLFAFERRFATQAEAADFSSSVTAGEALARFKAKLPPGLATQNLAERCQVIIKPGESVLTATVMANDSASARVLAEDFAAHVARCADEWVAKRGQENERQISAAQRRLQELRNKLGEASPAVIAAVTSTPVLAGESAVSAEMTALRAVQQELAQALARFTEEHPRVKELRASIAALQGEIAKQNPAALVVKRDSPSLLAKATTDKSAPKTPVNEIELARIKAEFSALTAYRDQLIQERVNSSGKDSEPWRQAEQVAVVRVTKSRFGYRW